MYPVMYNYWLFIKIKPKLAKLCLWMGKVDIILASVTFNWSFSGLLDGWIVRTSSGCSGLRRLHQLMVEYINVNFTLSYTLTWISIHNAGNAKNTYTHVITIINNCMISVSWSLQHVYCGKHRKLHAVSDVLPSTTWKSTLVKQLHGTF